MTGVLSLSLRGLGDNQALAGNTKAATGDDGPVSVIRYGIAHANDSASTVQGEREKAQ